MRLLSGYLDLIRAKETGSFAAIEPLFLEAIWKFDQLVISGLATQGDRQNTKGDFFNDVIEELLKRASGKKLHTRGQVPGLLFERHNLDSAYPAEGTPTFTIETKAIGTPKHPRSEKAKEGGRPGSADLDKRLKEAAFKVIDIKAEAARGDGHGGGAGGDLTHWLRKQDPRCYLFIAARVVNEGDLKFCNDRSLTAASWFEGCGLFAYQVNSAGTGYVSKKTHTSVQLDRVLSGASTALRNLP